MANLIQTTLIQEGPKDATFQVYLESDGSEGELVNYPIFDPSNDFKQPLPVTRNQNDSLDNILSVRKVAIMQAWISNSWFDVFLQYENTDGPDQNYRTVVLARDCDFYLDFRFFGGLKDFVPRDKASGRLMLSTKDFAPAGSKGWFLLTLRKYVD